VTESLFSMDGDVAPLDRYAELAARHGAELIVDDAHATGLFGEARGSGLCEAFGVERSVAAVVSTLGKAAGLAGAFVAGPEVLVEYLINRCRAFVFTTAPPPLLLLAVDAALDRMAAEPQRRRRTLELAQRLRARLEALGAGRPPGAGPIVPLLVGDNGRAVAAAERLAALGFDVRAIRPPTVPPGTARLRVSVHADHTEAEIDALAEALAATLAAPALAAALDGPALATALDIPALTGALDSLASVPALPGPAPTATATLAAVVDALASVSAPGATAPPPAGAHAAAPAAAADATDPAFVVAKQP